MSFVLPPTRKFWKTQKPVDYLDDSLVQNTWENVVADLSEGLPARIWFIILEQTNDGATAEDIELEVTIEGTTKTWSGTLDSGSQYYGFLDKNGDPQFHVANAQCTLRDVQPTGDVAIGGTYRDVGLIRVRQTSDVDGVSAQIEVNVVWDKME